MHKKSLQIISWRSDVTLKLQIERRIYRGLYQNLASSICASIALLLYTIYNFYFIPYRIIIIYQIPEGSKEMFRMYMLLEFQYLTEF